MKNNFIAGAIIVFALTAILTFSATCYVYICEEKDSLVEIFEAGPDKTELWEVYTSEVQGFSFKVPIMYSVVESDHYENKNMRTVSLIQMDKNDEAVQGPPAMQMHVWVEAGILESTLWEGIPFDHYEDVLKSFSFNSELTASK